MARHRLGDRAAFSGTAEVVRALVAVDQARPSSAARRRCDRARQLSFLFPYRDLHPRQCRPVIHRLAVEPLAEPCRRGVRYSRSSPIHDPPVEGHGFELSVPGRRVKRPRSRGAHGKVTDLGPSDREQRATAGQFRPHDREGDVIRGWIQQVPRRGTTARRARHSVRRTPMKILQSIGLGAGERYTP